MLPSSLLHRGLGNLEKKPPHFSGPSRIDVEVERHHVATSRDVSVDKHESADH